MANIEIFGKRYETSLVIFDKDGTLLDFKQTWVNIIRELFAAIGRRTSMHDGLDRMLQKALGVFTGEREIDGNGPFAMGTSSEVNTILALCLYLEGMRWDRAQEIVRQAEDEVFKGPVRERNLHVAQGALDLLKRLKARGILTALATNDNKSDSTRDMEVTGALAYLDLVVGSDDVKQSKPAPDMIHLICKRLTQNPMQTVMIGDTPMDAIMGRNAHVMLNIGVSGIVPQEVLASMNDVVIASLDEIN